MQEKIHDLFQDRYLFVKRRLKSSERKQLLFITRGLPQLRKLRERVSKKCFGLNSTDHEMDHRHTDHGFTRLG